MRVVHVTTVPLNLLFMRGFGEYLRRQGIDVHVVSSPGAGLDAYGEREGVATHGINIERRIAPTKDLESLARLTALFRQLAPDIVHAHSPKGGLLGMLASTVARVPTRIYHLRGMPLETAKGFTRSILWSTESTSARLSDTVICVSESLRQSLVRRHICDERKARVLLRGSGNGVDAEGRFNPGHLPDDARAATRRALGLPADAVVLTFVGRVAADKGIQELVAAWRRIRAERSNTRLLLVGTLDTRDPPERAVLQCLESDPHVVWVRGTDDVPRMYNASDILVLPTYREGFPSVVLEGSAMRLPIVATRVTGCVDAVVDGVTGELVPARDATTLSTRLLRYVDDNQRRRTHGEAGRAHVLRWYQQQLVWGAIKHLYDELSGR